MPMSLEVLGLGAVVGLILALTGAGGGILAVPLLVLGLHLPIAQAAPVGLIAVGLASGFGAILGLREGIVRYRAAALIGITGMALAPLGLRLARNLPNGPLTVGFAVVLAYVALRMLLRSMQTATPADASKHAHWPCVVNPQEGRLLWTLPCARLLAATGVASGLLSGLLGVGGGFVIVPALTRFTNLAPRSILATSLAVIALVSVSGVGAAAMQRSIEWNVALPFAAGSVAALLIGRRIAARVAGVRLQQIFALTSCAVSLLMLFKGLGWLARL
ncbi:MAG: sulfite exporter TauE/SafE family protein [Burkholderiales bacterium]|nr:sulfite exporter TauE/SafE family protein [Burkholderiales bacterium]